MNRLSPGLTLLFALAAGHAGGQTRDEKAPASAASITLEQLSPADTAQAGGKDRTSIVDVQQPTRPSQSAAVTASEISQRPDARSLTVAPAVGEDRCDGDDAARRSELCRRRIEARAGQYSRPAAAPVTPEARLLLLTNPDGRAASGEGRRASSGLDGPNGPAEQLAGALRDGMAGQDPATPASPGGLPSNVPPIVVIPPK